MLNLQRELDRNKLANLVKQGTDAKMCRGNPAVGLEKLDEARKLAEKVGSPWPQVVAYRLAHLQMRMPSPDLETAEALFRRAADLDALGALPWIYLAAVMQRRGRFDPRVLEEARARLGVYGSPLPTERAGIQSETCNMLELATYFTGAPYRLDGLGGAWERLFPKSRAWVLVGPVPETAQVRYARELAMTELRARHGEGYVVFWADAPRNRGFIQGRGEPRELPHQMLEMLALSLGGNFRTGEALARRMELGPEAFRKARSRLGGFLGEVQGLGGSAFLPETNRGGLPRLCDPRVCGAVPAQGIHWSSRSPTEAC